MKKLLGVAVAGVGILCAAAGTHGADSAKTPDAGDAAPPFTLPGSDGAKHDLAKLAEERAVVVAWYPKAFTGG